MIFSITVRHIYFSDIVGMVSAVTDFIIILLLKAVGVLLTAFNAVMHSRTMPGFLFSMVIIISRKIGISSSSYSIGVVQRELRSRRFAHRHRMSLYVVECAGKAVNRPPQSLQNSILGKVVVEQLKRSGLTRRR